MNNKFLNALLKTQHLKNSLYAILKHNFLYHSNKIEGSTFTTEALALLLDKNVVTGRHTLDDVQDVYKRQKLHLFLALYWVHKLIFEYIFK